jgi:tetratricopeptide (TPR) repeat protein
VKNMYRFTDLNGLKKYNEALYYMVLRDSVLHSLTGNLNDMIALFDYYLKLGFVEKALDVGHSFHREPSLLGHIGRILQVNGYAADALEFLNRVRGENAEVENQRIRAYLQLEQFEQAEKAAANPLLATNLETLNLKVKLAGKAGLSLREYLRRVDRMLDVQVKMAAAVAGEFSSVQADSREKVNERYLQEI